MWLGGTHPSPRTNAFRLEANSETTVCIMAWTSISLFSIALARGGAVARPPPLTGRLLSDGSPAIAVPFPVLMWITRGGGSAGNPYPTNHPHRRSIHVLLWFPFPLQERLYYSYNSILPISQGHAMMDV